MAHLNLTPEGERFLEQWGDSRPYIVAHTSGSTGRPKEIHLLKADMSHSARLTNKAFGITSQSHLVCPLSADYIAGKMMIVRAIEAQCRLDMEPPSNEPLRSDYGGDVDLLPIVPSQIDGLLRSPNVTAIRNVIVGGAPISARQEQLLLGQKGFECYATYGMTETCSHVALRRLGESEFVAMPGVLFFVDNRNCLGLKSDGFSFGSIQTNDIVDLISPNRFLWRGRYDNVVISGGLKFYPEEIESKISATLGWHDFFITDCESEKWGRELVLVLTRAFCRPDSIPKTTDDIRVNLHNEHETSHPTCGENAEVSGVGVEISGIEAEGYDEKLRNYVKRCLREILSAKEMPKQIVFVNQLPRTGSGKLLRCIP